MLCRPDHSVCSRHESKHNTQVVRGGPELPIYDATYASHPLRCLVARPELQALCELLRDRLSLLAGSLHLGQTKDLEAAAVGIILQTAENPIVGHFARREREAVPAAAG